MSSTNWFLNLTAAFLANISLALLIREWLSLKESWTVLEAADQQWKALICLSSVTFLLLLLHWVLVLTFVRDIDEGMVLATTYPSRPELITAPLGDTTTR